MAQHNFEKIVKTKQDRFVRYLRVHEIAGIKVCKKRCYSSRAGAKKHIKDLYRNSEESREDLDRLQTYFCSLCRAWHCGHSSYFPAKVAK